MQHLRGFVVLAVLILLSVVPGHAQEQSDDEINPAALRRYWLGAIGPQVVASPYELTAAERTQHGGTFGLDLSHYTFDIQNKDPKCKTALGYADRGCSCSIEWRRVQASGIRFVYLKATDGLGTDLSFQRAWSELAYYHREKKLFRGAYHFLRPSSDPELQADNFLSAIGRAGVQYQLPPVLDIEWSNKRIEPGDEEFEKCPPSRKVKTEKGVYYCDMWYKLSASEISDMATRWINKVELATGQKVIIYTNPVGWWNPVMLKHDDSLVQRRAIWTSRYTSQGPEYNPAWDRQGGSSKWKMAPLPRGAKFPTDVYDIPHIWQFTESGYLSTPALICGGEAQKRYMDLNWMPAPEADLPKLFGRESAR